MIPEDVFATARKLAAGIVAAAVVAVLGALAFAGWVLYTLVTWVVR